MNPNRYGQRIADCLQAPIVVVDREYRIVDVNEAARLKFARATDEIVGRHCYRVLHASDRPCFELGTRCPVNQVFQTGRPARAVHQHRRSKDEVVWEEVWASPLEDREGRLTYVVEEVRDATELLRSEEISGYLRASVQGRTGFLPICANCKKIRDRNGRWERVESYIRDHFLTELTHGLCPECLPKLYPSLDNISES